MHVDFEYYTGVFGSGFLKEDGFAGAVREAESYIRYLTYVNGDIFADSAHAETVKAAVCAAADAWAMAAREQEEGGNVKSESKDGFSVSFAVARKDGETAGDYGRRCMYQAVRHYLLPIGWLSRRAGCRYDHKCGCCDCL